MIFGIALSVVIVVSSAVLLYQWWTRMVADPLDEEDATCGACMGERFVFGSCAHCGGTGIDPCPSAEAHHANMAALRKELAERYALRSLKPLDMLPPVKRNKEEWRWHR